MKKFLSTGLWSFLITLVISIIAIQIFKSSRSENLNIVEITFTNGDKDTVNIAGYFWINSGDLSSSRTGSTLYSFVRSYKILKTY